MLNNDNIVNIITRQDMLSLAAHWNTLPETETLMWPHLPAQQKYYQDSAPCAPEA